MEHRRRTNPSAEAHCCVIAETWDPESMSARHDIHCPHLPRIRILAVPKMVMLGLMAVPTNTGDGGSEDSSGENSGL